MKLSKLAPTVLALSAAFLFTSCEEDNTPKFTIDGFEYALSNNVLNESGETAQTNEGPIRYHFDSGLITFDGRMAGINSLIPAKRDRIYEIRNIIAGKTGQKIVENPFLKGSSTTPESSIRPSMSSQ